MIEYFYNGIKRKNLKGFVEGLQEFLEGTVLYMYMNKLSCESCLVVRTYLRDV